MVSWAVLGKVLSEPEGGDLPLYSVLMSPRMECCAQFWATQHKRDMDVLQIVQQRTMKTLKGLGHLKYEERLRVQLGEE